LRLASLAQTVWAVIWTGMLRLIRQSFSGLLRLCHMQTEVALVATQRMSSLSKL